MEFFGIVRTRAENEFIEIEASTVAGAIAGISTRLPDVAGLCFDNGCLKPGYLININGTKFTSHGCRTLRDGDTLLLMSSDAGG